VIGAIAVAAIVGLSSAADPADRLLDAGGVKLHIHCAGARSNGQPLVVLEAGAGNSSATWNDVVAPIASFARVCAYDRANLGSSGRTTKPLTGAAHTEMLHALLAAAREAPPYVLAGHSYGGMIVRLFASRYPRDVSGLVLVDSSHEDQIERFAVLTPPPAPPAPPSQAAPAGQSRETIDLPATSAELKADPWHGDIPVIVLSRGLWLKTPPAVPDPLAAARLGIWQDLHRELATRSPRGEVIVATRSGHYIQNDEPPLVIDAVHRVIR